MQHQQFALRNDSHPVDLILTALVEKPMHALALHENLERAAEIRIAPGAFHRVVTRLEQLGWIEGTQSKGTLRLYHITALGLLTLEKNSVERLKQHSRDMWSPSFRRRKERMMRLVIWMLRLYPRAWRERYAPEMIALLEQHSITLWTVIDLLFGALDARLDPYYHRERLLIPRLPWHGLQTSWNLMLTAFVIFWLTQILWVSGGGVWGPLSFSWPTTDITLLPGVLAYLSLPLILTALVGWIGWQSSKNAWNLLRLLPVALFVQLLLLSPWLDGWQNALLWLVLLLSLTLTASNLGWMLTTLKHWEKRINLPLAIGSRLFALFLIIGMALLCFTNVSWMRMFWESSWNLAVSPYWWYGPVTLTLELATMMLATLLAAIALGRSLIELKALKQKTHTALAMPKQEPHSALAHALSDQPPEPGSPHSIVSPVIHTSMAPARQKAWLHPITWLLISPVLLVFFLFSFFLITSFTYTFDTNISSSLVSSFLLFGVLVSLFIAFAVSFGTRKNTSHPKQAHIFQHMQMVHERN
jgi:DNA-binding PadR family transcriptional regulator